MEEADDFPPLPAASATHCSNILLNDAAISDVLNLATKLSALGPSSLISANVCQIQARSLPFIGFSSMSAVMRWLAQIFRTCSRLITMRRIPLVLWRRILMSPIPLSFHSLPMKRNSLVRSQKSNSSSSSPDVTVTRSGKGMTGSNCKLASSPSPSSPRPAVDLLSTTEATTPSSSDVTDMLGALNWLAEPCMAVLGGEA